MVNYQKPGQLWNPQDEQIQKLSLKAEFQQDLPELRSKTKTNHKYYFDIDPLQTSELNCENFLKVFLVF